jgi:hypothetical protein
VSRPADNPRYTRFVIWRQRTAIAIVFVLAAIPVGRTMCAIACIQQSSAAVPHHAAGQSCEEMAPAAAVSSIDNGLAADCGSHDAVHEQVATTASGRDGLNGASVVVSPDGRRELATPAVATAISPYAAPPGTDPPTTIRLVLRV